MGGGGCLLEGEGLLKSGGGLNRGFTIFIFMANFLISKQASPQSLIFKTTKSKVNENIENGYG